MASAFLRSWTLGKQSLSVLRENKSLMIFPIMSAIACILVMASFAVPAILTVDWQALSNDEAQREAMVRSPIQYAILFAFYFVNYTVIAFFNAALVACVMRYYDGKPATVGDGIRVALSRLPQILGWALISATVGMILRAIAERSGVVGRIVIGLIGFVWSVATYFVVPVLVVEGVGPIEAIKRSGATIRRTWGESLVTNLGLGAMSFLAFMVALIPVAVGGAISIATESPWAVAVGGALTVVLLVAATLVTSTLQVILVAALYRFASSGQVPAQFEGDLLKRAFREKTAPRG